VNEDVAFTARPPANVIVQAATFPAVSPVQEMVELVPAVLAVAYVIPETPEGKSSEILTVPLLAKAAVPVF
jgi:hypothetical protein